MPSRFILVVDTSPVSWQRVGRALQGTPSFAMSARSVAEAVAAATAGDIALVVGSMRLPDGGGYELARKVRAARPAARVLLLADGPERYDPAAGEAAGVSGCIAWPCPVDRLRAQLEEALTLLPDPAEPAADDTTTDPLSLLTASAGLDPVEPAALRGAEPAPEEPPSVDAEPVEPDPVDPEPVEPEPVEGSPLIEPLDALESIDTVESIEPDAAPPQAHPPERPRPPQTPVGDERLASFLPRDWKALPPVRVDPAVVMPAVERAILEVLPEVVEVVLRQALATSPGFRDLVEAAVDEAVRAQLGPIARSVVRERLAEIEAASEDA